MSQPPYSLSNKRIREKLDKMIDTLLTLGNQELSTKGTLCMDRDLGQDFNAYRQPIHKNLYRFNYVDESDFQWAFAYNVDKNNDKVIITKMMPSIYVKEFSTLTYNQNKDLN